MKKLVILLALGLMAFPTELAEARGGRRGGSIGGRSRGADRARRRVKARDAREAAKRDLVENRDGLLRDAGLDVI